MKYCKKCGMLLEDTIETCIRCGTDVSIVENISFFPPDVQESMDEENNQKKDGMKTVILIICILVALVAVIVAGAMLMNSGNLGFMMQDTGNSVVEESQVDEEVVDDATTESEIQEAVADDEASNDTEVASDSATATDNEAKAPEVKEEEPAAKAIKDTKGHYYNYVSEADEAGNVVLNVLYPEDFDTVDFAVSYDKFSNRFPLEMTFSASGEDGGVQFLYMSPRQLWHKESETGKSYANNKIADYYMTFYKYDGAKGYIEAMLKESYPKAKIECVNEAEISTKATEGIEALSASKKKDLFERIKYYDYANIGRGTTYAIMEEAEYSANIYEYEITTTDKQVIFDKFYVPVIANKLYYANEDNNDRGNITEWYYLAFAVMEAGNEDLYDDYSADFDVFVDNCVPTETFMKINQQYSDEINTFVAAKRTVEPITNEQLEEYASNTSCKLNDFNASVLNVLRAQSGASYANDKVNVNVPDKIKVGFINKDANKIFLSEGADEYPGESYDELTKGDVLVSEGTKEEIKVPDDYEETNSTVGGSVGIDSGEESNQRVDNSTNETSSDEATQVVDKPKKKRSYKL